MTSIQSQASSKALTKADSRPRQFQRPVASAPIQMEIVFGRPSKDCQDIGICRISMLPKKTDKLKQQCNCNQKAIAWVQQLPNGNLVFRFSKNQITQKNIGKQFREGYFTVLENYYLPDYLKTMYYPRISIRKGKYPIQIIENNLVIIV